MSNYDLTAIASDPDFYLSSASMSDQSGKALYVLDNDALNIGQPIIAGNESSFLVDETHPITFDSNPIFFKANSSLEIVGYFSQPTDSTCIFGDTDNYNGLFIDPSGFELRFVDRDLSSKYLRVNIYDWPVKAHVTISFDVESVTLDVNDKQAQLSYASTDPSTVGDISFKSLNTYFYLIDGIGIYSHKFINKSNLINSLEFDYFNFTSGRYGAVGTNFAGYRMAESKTLSNQDFLKHPEGYYMCSYILNPQIDESIDYVTFECSNSDILVTYKIDALSEDSFLDKDYFESATEIFSITLKILNEDYGKPFQIKINSYFEGSVTTQTPARMTLVGAAFFPEQLNIKLVDCPQGIYLGGAEYNGEWYVDSPKSIEIVFMALNDEDTFIFSSPDGSASFGTGGAVTGFTAYLNGVLVANLDDVIVNQWNHLVLTKSSVSATEFNLNESQSGGENSNIRYLYLNAFPNQLDAAQALQLYKIVSSSHKLSLMESLSPIIEGEAEYDSPFLLYSYAWSIIGNTVG